ncbi:MAG: co-chaperone GroES [Candidatus Doudnabacteria bacterium]|nr:co-chaperone GroES [Candidatus Doudnabacteria bacterium]
MNIKPLGDRVVIKPVSKEETTKPAIILPDTVEKDKKEEGEVMAIGPGEKVRKLGLKIGDKILFSGWPKEIKVGEEEYKVVSEEDILAVIE